MREQDHRRERARARASERAPREQTPLTKEAGAALLPSLRAGVASVHETPRPPQSPQVSVADQAVHVGSWTGGEGRAEGEPWE